MSPSNDLPEITIEPSNRKQAFAFGEIWLYRELLYQLAWRDIVVRYKQTFLGIAWVVITPLVTAAIFALIFGLLARIPTNDTPPVVFFLAGLIPHLFFSSGVQAGANSMVSQRALFTKIYFPRILLPLAATVAPLLDFFVALIVLLGICFHYGFFPGFSDYIWMLIVAIWIWMAAVGVGFWFGALNVYFRDVKQIVPFVLRISFFVSPILYPASMIPKQWHWLYALNPMSGAIELFRWILFKTTPLPSPVFLFSILVTVIVFVTGAFYFQRTERTFADVV